VPSVGVAADLEGVSDYTCGYDGGEPFHMEKNFLGVIKIFAPAPDPEFKSPILPY